MVVWLIKIVISISGMMENAFGITRHNRLILNGGFEKTLARHLLINHQRDISSRSDGMNRTASKTQVQIGEEKYPVSIENPLKGAGTGQC